MTAPSSTEKRSKIAPLKMITRDMETSRCRCPKPRVSKANAKAERERETVHEAGRRQQGLQTDSTQKRAPCFWLMLEGFGILENGGGRRAMGG